MGQICSSSPTTGTGALTPLGQMPISLAVEKINNGYLIIDPTNYPQKKFFIRTLEEIPAKLKDLFEQDRNKFGN